MESFGADKIRLFDEIIFIYFYWIIRRNYFTFFTGLFDEIIFLFSNKSINHQFCSNVPYGRKETSWVELT
jgi:hypothetical protein